MRHIYNAMHAAQATRIDHPERSGDTTTPPIRLTPPKGYPKRIVVKTRLRVGRWGMESKDQGGRTNPI